MARTWMVAGAVLGVLTGVGGAGARSSTVSDFAVCNGEADAATAPGPPDRDRQAAVPAPAAPGTPEREAPAPGQASPPTAPAPRGGMSSGTDSSGKLVTGTRDPRLEGMAADRAGDPPYREAYRECMMRRGVTAPPSS